MIIVQRFDAEGDLYDMTVLTMALIRDSFLADGITHLHAACARPTWRVPLDALNSCSDLWLDTLHGQYSLSWNMLDHGNGRQLTLGGVYLGTMQRRNRTLNFRQCQRKHGRWRRSRRISTLISRILSCSSSLGPWSKPVMLEFLKAIGLHRASLIPKQSLSWADLVQK